LREKQKRVEMKVSCIQLGMKNEIEMEMKKQEIRNEK
jgi:hypothetical protein